MEGCTGSDHQAIGSLQKEEPKRRSANYHPCVWGDFFLQYASNSEEKYLEEGQEHDRLQEEVRNMITVEEYSGRKLDLVDAVHRLGVSYLFEEEMKTLVPAMFKEFEEDASQDLHVVALRFRLLRQLGHYVSCDVFNKFKDLEGNFKASVMNNVRGLVSLLEAAHYRVQDEDVLDEALIFTTSRLQSLLPSLDHFFTRLVKQTLDVPIQKTLPRIGAKQFIPLYEADELHNEALLRFAKLDFNRLQRMHQRELSSLTTWWKGADFTNKLPFARHRLVETYLWAVGVYFEPKYSFGRVTLTQVTSLMTPFDDIYDVYGTLPELIPLTDAIQRWDPKAMEELPEEYLRHFCRTVLDLIAEKEKALAKHGRSNFVNYAISSYQVVAKAYLQEAKWLYSDHVPSLETYKEIAYDSAAYRMMAANSVMGMAEFINEDALVWVNSNPAILRASTIITRLKDDIATHEAERKRGESATSVECHMRQYGTSQEEAIVELQKEITNVCWT